MSIAIVGSPASSQGTGVVTRSVSPTATGDATVAVFMAENGSATNPTISGGGVTTWHTAASYADTTHTVPVFLWWGLVTSTGASTVSIGGSFASSSNGIWWAQFHESNSSLTWSQVAASPAPGSSGAPSGSSTVANCPSLTASGATDYLYAGALYAAFNGMTNQGTTGFTFDSCAGFNRMVTAYNPSFSGTGDPTWTQSPFTGDWDSVGMILGTSGAAAAAAPQPALVNRPALIVSNSGWRGAGHSR